MLWERGAPKRASSFFLLGGCPFFLEGGSITVILLFHVLQLFHVLLAMMSDSQINTRLPCHAYYIFTWRKFISTHLQSSYIIRSLELWFSYLCIFQWPVPRVPEAMCSPNQESWRVPPELSLSRPWSDTRPASRTSYRDPSLTNYSVSLWKHSRKPLQSKCDLHC